jgi:hypothetical protein
MPIVSVALLSLVFEASLPPAPSSPVTVAGAEAASAGSAFEVNVLWPFFPGGLSEIKLLVPVAGSGDHRGELLLGLHSDFGTRFVRPDARYGKVSILGAKVGYRQFLAAGLHVEGAVNAGWRHESHNVWDGTTLDAFSARLWLMAGYQQELGGRAYANLRAGAGIHLLRTDRFADKERRLVPAADLNLGFRF